MLQEERAIDHSEHLDAGREGSRQLRHGIGHHSPSMAASADGEAFGVS